QGAALGRSMTCFRTGPLRIRCGRRADLAAAWLVQHVAEQAAHRDVTYRDQQHSEHRCGEHTAYYAGADVVPAVGACAGRHDHRENAEDESERRHDDGPEAKTRRFQNRVVEAAAVALLGHRELHDENGVLRSEPNDGDEAYFEINIVRQSAG